MKFTHPDSEELHAFALGRCEPERAAEIESFLAHGPDCVAMLEAGPDDALICLLRGAGPLPKADTATVDTLSDSPKSNSAEELDDSLFHDHPRYRLIRQLGHGGMGVVYLAEHRLMRRLVAIKRIRAGYLDRPQLVQRFRQEVEAAARLTHPNIVTAYDADQAGGPHFLVMEFVEGDSSGPAARELGPLPVAEACDYVRQAALGLQYAHDKAWFTATSSRTT